VAEWGDVIDNLGTGHRVKRVHFTGGRTFVSDFVTGLSNPIDVAQGPSGALLIADYGSGTIWRVQAKGH
jgi:glucose/arabinose dehydrogenase